MRRVTRLATRGFGATIFAATVLIGAAAASTGPEVCSTGDQPACLTISDTDDVARSTESTSRYGTFSFAVRNAHPIKLHSTLALELVDVVDGVAQPTSAAFSAPLPAGCSSPAPDELFCSLPTVNGGATIAFGPAVVRTSTNEAADATRVLATLARAPHADKPAETLVTSSEDMVYGAVGETSKSVVFAGASTVLETSDEDEQSSEFPINVPPSFVGFLLTTIGEFDEGDEGYYCPSETDCFGQSVTTFAPGIFSPANPANLLVTIQRSAVPKSISSRNLVVTHRRGSGPTVEITRTCKGAIGTVPPASQIPCRRISLNSATQIFTIDVWDVDQGDWGFS